MNKKERKIERKIDCQGILIKIVSLSTAQINPDTYFHGPELDRYLRFLLWQHVLDSHVQRWRPCHVPMTILDSIVPDNSLLGKLRVLHPKKVWIFCLIDKNSICLAKANITKRMSLIAICRTIWLRMLNIENTAPLIKCGAIPFNIGRQLIKDLYGILDNIWIWTVSLVNVFLDIKTMKVS